jgi:hypothetical protein
MRSRAAVTVFAIALFVLATPSSAQDEFTGVSFGGVSFAFGPELGESVNITRVPGQETEQRGVLPPDPRHLTFTFYGSAKEGDRPPRVGFTGGTVRAYRLADMAEDEASSAQLDALRALLEDPAALEASMDVSDDGGDPLPHMPAELGAAQSLRARATTIDAVDMTGISYIAGYRQDVFPFAAGDFFYSFQALSNDGEWYISGDFVVEATMFPQRVRARDAEGVQRQARWQAYLEESITTLNAASPDAFEPSLTSIDILIESFTFFPTSEDSTSEA